MRFQVPQFIDIEDKVVGPLTIKQFIYLAGGAGMSFIVWTYVPKYIALIIIVGIVILSLALAFYKINNKPFVDFLEAMVTYYTHDRLYIWKKQEKKIEHVENTGEGQGGQVFVPRLSQSKLKDLSWSLDINENVNPLTGENGKTTK